ncbi:hypothetical protein M3557_02645 [Bhargavaea ginsengi]|uniref:hypothetical protein n=1 Tax=Bhargavaea ginsengi TaxID=426757 RepID=UPI002041A930|nr:hypothetical protein [Bhargavaea ginsengi]MCM3086804.1 hypothetical protein [Bhargavaea ginsengi]
MNLISGFLLIFVLSALQHLVSRRKELFWIIPIPFVFLLVMVYAYNANYIESSTKFWLLSIVGILLLIGEGIRTQSKRKEQLNKELEKMKARDI